MSSEGIIFIKENTWCQKMNFAVFYFILHTWLQMLVSDVNTCNVTLLYLQQIYSTTNMKNQLMTDYTQHYGDKKIYVIIVQRTSFLTSDLSVIHSFWGVTFYIMKITHLMCSNMQNSSFFMITASFVYNRARHKTAISGTTFLAPCHVVKSL